MNKAQLIDEVAIRTGLTKAKARHSLNGFLDTIESTLANGDNVSLVDFGTFTVNERKERSGRNPLTGEPLLIQASKSPSFKPSKKIKSSCNS